MATKLARKKTRTRNGLSKTHHKNGYSLTRDFDSIKKAIFGATEHAKAKAGRLLDQSIDTAKDKSDLMKHNVARYAKVKPFKALGIALVTGACLGFLMRR